MTLLFHENKKNMAKSLTHIKRINSLLKIKLFSIRRHIDFCLFVFYLIIIFLSSANPRKYNESCVALFKYCIFSQGIFKPKSMMLLQPWIQINLRIKLYFFRKILNLSAVNAACLIGKGLRKEASQPVDRRLRSGSSGGPSARGSFI
jgi:hypothetical protein